MRWWPTWAAPPPTLPSCARVTSADPALARALARLERRGLAIYSGFTPTDAAHVLGLSGHWCGEAAELAARLWARQMREIYGLRRWDEGDARAASQAVFDQVVVSITHALVEAGLHDRHRWERIGAGGLGDQLARLMLEDAQAPDRQPVISARFVPTLPL